MSFPSKKRLTLAEVLGNIDFFTEYDEKGPMKSKTTIFVTPPQEVDNDLLNKTVLMKTVLNLISIILGESYCVLKQKLIDRVQHFW